MAYIKNTWVDQEVERPRTYQKEDHADGSFTLIDDFGLVSELGTPVNADNMNHIEEGIGEHEERITALENAPNKFVKKSGDTMTGTLYATTPNGVGFTVQSATIEKGVTPETNQYVNIQFKDKNNEILTDIYTRQGSDGVNYAGIAFYGGTTRYLQLGENANGTPHFAFPMCTAKANATSSASTSCVAVVVQNYKNGNSWYRVWSDGWIEQGGAFTGNGGNTTVTFPKAFTTTNYSINVQHLITDDVQWEGSPNSLKTNNFIMYSAGSVTYRYYACGY